VLATARDYLLDLLGLLKVWFPISVNCFQAA
jgi:hypothetical protein